MVNLIRTTSILLAFFSAFCHGIYMRHDVAAGEYQARLDDFPALVSIYKKGVYGSLIAPRWVLTTAHSSYCLKPGSWVSTHAGMYQVKATYNHLRYKGSGSYDIALVELQQQVEGIKPARLYQQTDEVGQSVWLIGGGQSGTGDGRHLPENASSSILRKAQNQIKDASQVDLILYFDHPEEAEPLEGSPGNGDSGSPAFIVKNNEHYVLGISSRTHSWFTGQGQYGVREKYTRVASLLSWLENIMQGNAALRHAISTPIATLPTALHGEELQNVCESLSYQPFHASVGH